MIHSHTYAATPDAGRLLQETQPPAIKLPESDTSALPAAKTAEPTQTAPDTTKLRLQTIHIKGAKAFSEEQLQAIVADLIGREITISQLREGVERITQFYRSQGYLLARAILPAQSIDNGIVDIDILEGRLGEIALDNESPVSDKYVRDRLQQLPVDQALKTDQIEKTLLLLNDTPGIDVRSTLTPGASVGTTNLDIMVRSGRRFEGVVGVDNDGNRYTGEYRFDAGFTINSPLGIGDALQTQIVTAGSGFNYGRIGYQLPINSIGTRLGVAYASLDYKLGQDFDNLDASGTARISSIFLTHPFIRSRNFNLNGQLSFDHKELNDEIGLVNFATKKTLNNVTFGLSSDRTDNINEGGVTQAVASLTMGNLSLDSASAALDAEAHKTAGGFLKSNFQILRLQRLTNKLSFYGQLSAQFSNTNLDSAEKMTLGGSYGVRAYPQGEAPSDKAWLTNLELRYKLADQWQSTAFYDIAQGYLNHSPITGDGDNRRTLSGVGFGLKWTNPQNYSFQGTLAWRTSGEPTSDRDRTPRFWIQFVKNY